MVRKARRMEARARHRDFMLSMADGFQSYRKEGRDPQVALALVDGDMAVMARKHPSVKAASLAAQRDFRKELQNLVEALA